MDSNIETHKCKLSVIIPIYNNEQYLKECLDSICNQTLSDIEIICVNDGSEDNSLQIIEEYKQKDNRIILINQDNMGQSSARNNGLKIATGEYIGFVDSDDYIDQDFYEKLYNSAKQNNLDMAVAGIVRFKGIRRRYMLNFSDEIIEKNLNKKMELCKIPRQCYVVNKIYKRDVLLAHNLFFKEGVYYEDVGFTIRAIYFLNGLITVPGTYYNYRKNYNSTVKTISDKKNQDMINARKDMLAFAREHNIEFKYRPDAYITKMTKYNFLGLTIMKVVEYETMKKYYLFSRWLIFNIRSYV